MAVGHELRGAIGGMVWAAQQQRDATPQAGRWIALSLALLLVQRPAYPSLPQWPAVAPLERARGATNLK